MVSIPVGLKVSSFLVEEIFPYLDDVVTPFDSIWFSDHLQYSNRKMPEGWSLLAYALARYPDKLCGHEVLCNSFRNPAHLAKMVATTQIISGGRVVVGIGAGWLEEEYKAYGWPFPSARIRIAQLAEAIELMRLLWREAPVNYQGQHYQVVDAYCEPQPELIPPVMVGGSGEKYLLRCVAQHADWWNYRFDDSKTYTRKQEVLKSHCQAVGREYDEIKQVLGIGILIAESDRELARLKEEIWVRSMDNVVSGTPTQITEALLGIIRQGTDRLTVRFIDAPRLEGAHLFAATVLPHLTG